MKNKHSQTALFAWVLGVLIAGASAVHAEEAKPEQGKVCCSTAVVSASPKPSCNEVKETEACNEPKPACDKAKTACGVKAAACGIAKTACDKAEAPCGNARTACGKAKDASACSK